MGAAAFFCFVMLIVAVVVAVMSLMYEPESSGQASYIAAD